MSARFARDEPQAAGHVLVVMSLYKPLPGDV